MARPNRWCASISSKPLFRSVAESIVIRPPICQVGCASASSGVTPLRSVRPRNGPPDAVSTSRSTLPGAFARTSWNRAECSESTGMIRVSVASASAVTSSPPTTRLSLLARASSMPSVSATIVGPSPAEPTTPFKTRSAPDSATSSLIPSSPLRTLPFQAAAAALAAPSSARATVGTPWSRACSIVRSQPRPRRARPRRARPSARPPRAPARPPTPSSPGSPPASSEAV